MASVASVTAVSAVASVVRVVALLSTGVGALWASGCAGPLGRQGLRVKLDQTHMTDERWASSENLDITINAYGREKQVLTSGHHDYKPSWSKTGSMLTFFRALRTGTSFASWKTKLCVVNADGSGLRELSSGDYADFNPTWTRDGTNQIIFNRYARGGDREANEAYMMAPDGSVGEERRISNPENRYEWAHTALKDGRILVDTIIFKLFGRSIARSYLLTPNPGGIGKYEEVARPTTKIWHKVSLSPSETKIAYMLDNDGDPSTYNDVVLYYADFDVASRTVSNPVPFTEYNLSCIDEYPRWNADESLIIYDSTCWGDHQMYAYRLADGVTARISSNLFSSYAFGNFEGLPK